MPRRKLSGGATATHDRRVRVLPAPATDSTKTDEVDEVARAEARAEAARARARALRQQADATPSDQRGRRTSRRRLLRRPGRRGLLAAAAVAVVCASLAASAYLLQLHRGVVAQRQRTAEFAAAARDGVLTMMSMSSDKARSDMQRFADDTTGIFKASILMGAEDAVKALEQSKVSAKASVQSVAVESMTDNSATVLVAAKTEFTKPGQAKPESRSSRLVISIQREGGQLKISRVEFVP